MKASIYVTNEGFEVLVFEQSYHSGFTNDLFVVDPQSDILLPGVDYGFVMKRTHNSDNLMIGANFYNILKPLPAGSKKVGLPEGLTTDDLGTLSLDILTSIDVGRYNSEIPQSFLERVMSAYSKLSLLNQGYDDSSIKEGIYKSLRDLAPHQVGSYLAVPLHKKLQNFQTASVSLGNDAKYFENFFSRKTNYLSPYCVVALIEASLTGQELVDDCVATGLLVFLADSDYVRMLSVKHSASSILTELRKMSRPLEQVSAP